MAPSQLRAAAVVAFPLDLKLLASFSLIQICSRVLVGELSPVVGEVAAGGANSKTH